MQEALILLNKDTWVNLSIRFTEINCAIQLKEGTWTRNSK
jgi:hypothetical protein